MRQQGRVVLADPLQPGPRRHSRRRLRIASLGRHRHRESLALADDRVALGLDLRDLALHEGKPLRKAQDLLPGPRRERRSVCGPHFGEPGLEALGAGLQVEDAVQLQEPFDRVGQRCPLLHQAPALFDLPVRRMIPLVPMPSALCSTIRARQTCFWATLPSPTSASRRRRSAGLKMMLMPGRMSQTRTQRVRRESPSGFKCQILSTSDDTRVIGLEACPDRSVLFSNGTASGRGCAP